MEQYAFIILILIFATGYNIDSKKEITAQALKL